MEGIQKALLVLCLLLYLPYDSGTIRGSEDETIDSMHTMAFTVDFGNK